MKFHIGTIASIITEYLLSPDKMDGVYKILDHMTNDKLFTHQLPRARRECAPFILQQHPQLTSLIITKEDRTENEEGEPLFFGLPVNEYIQKLADTYGEELDILPIPEKAHEVIHPLEEPILQEAGKNNKLNDLEMRIAKLERVVHDMRQTSPVGFFDIIDD